jgi:hypothetical protein
VAQVGEAWVRNIANTPRNLIAVELFTRRGDSPLEMKRNLLKTHQEKDNLCLVQPVRRLFEICAACA